MNKDRREYSLSLIFNGRRIRRVLIDPHYEIRHKDSVQDLIILKLVRLLHLKELPMNALTQSGFEIYRIDSVALNEKTYRLIVTLPPLDADRSDDYLGVINAFRVSRPKKRGGTSSGI